MAADKNSGSDSEILPLRIAGSWLQALTDGSKEIVALLDEDGGVQYLSVSGAVQHILGYEALEIMGMQPNELLHPLDRTRVLDGFRTVAAHPGGRISVEFRARHRVGHYVRLEATAVNRLRNEYVNAIVVHIREVHALEPGPPPRSSALPTPRLESEDGFLRAIDEAIEKAAGGEYKFSAMLLELESAEGLEEAYGPEVREGVLIEVGRRLHALLRPGDKLARLKSGQYSILLDGVGDRGLAERIASRIQKTVGNRFSVRGQDVLSSALVGIATSSRVYDRAEDVLRDAMMAVTKAKGDGADRRAVFRTHMQVEKTRHMSLVAELHNALQRNQFRVHYMPTVNLATRTVSGFEALARWYHPERGVISPDLFIPIAEETGLIVRLGRWVLLQACRQMAEWQTRYNLDPPLSVSVNLSAKQFADYDLDDQVENILEDTGLSPELLTLEIDEQAVMEHRDAVVDAVQRIRKLGTKISLDNFGTAPSSFTNLHILPYDRLNIDRSLIARMSESGRGRDIVQAIIGLAHDLSMEVVGEGVETPGQAAQLSKLWCEYAQGYLFGKPMDADAAGALIASYPRWWS